MKVDDATLVRAPRWLVHRRLADPESWPSWWPGLRRLGAVGADPLATHHLALTLRRPWRPAGHLRLAVTPWGHRLDRGLHLVVRGDVVARSEWWLEEATGGTILHHVATIDPGSRAPDAWRGAMRRAGWALDDRLSDEVRRVVAPDAAAQAEGTP